MSDNTTTPVPAEPAPKGSAGKKMTTRLIAIQPTENRPAPNPIPQTIRFQRPVGAAPKPAAAPGGKGDTARIGTAPAVGREGIQPGPAPERKSETIRISLADVLAQPQKPVDARQITMPISELMDAETPRPPTIQPKRPATSPIAVAMEPGMPAAKTMEKPRPPEGIRPRPAPERKSETIRISLADVLAQPQKPVDARQVTMPISELFDEEAARPPTIQLKRPATSPITVVLEPGMAAAKAKQKTGPLEDSTVVRPAEAGAKKGTTRMILDATEDTVPTQEAKRITSPITVIPQTIRLKRPGVGTASTAPTQVKARTDAIGEASTLGRMPDLSQAKNITARIEVEQTEPARSPSAESKRKTAPIPTAPPTPGTAPTPRTIRLKRPSSADLDEAAPVELSDEAPTVQKQRKAETAKIELPPEAEQVPITQRKTIKIKRTERNVAPRTVKMLRPEAAAAAVPEEMPAAEEAVPEETPGFLFFAIAAAAVVLIACLVYVMAAQAFGPGLALPVPAALL